jgi:hypothetical protein
MVSGRGHQLQYVRRRGLQLCVGPFSIHIGHRLNMYRRSIASVRIEHVNHACVLRQDRPPHTWPRCSIPGQ